MRVARSNVVGSGRNLSQAEEWRSLLPQRGGDPTAFDRILGSRLGTAAVEGVAEEGSGAMATLSGELIVTLPLREVVRRMRSLDSQMYRMAGVLPALPE